jgi:hypothetical protein
LLGTTRTELPVLVRENDAANGGAAGLRAKGKGGCLVKTDIRTVVVVAPGSSSPAKALHISYKKRPSGAVASCVDTFAFNVLVKLGLQTRELVFSAPSFSQHGGHGRCTNKISETLTRTKGLTTSKRARKHPAVEAQAPEAFAFMT